MESEAMKPTPSGPRACRACAASKAKCIFFPDSSAIPTNGKCRRCNRMNKECVMQTPAVRKPRARKSTRVDQLEERIENLVSLLQGPGEIADSDNDGLNTTTSQSALQPTPQLSASRQQPTPTSLSSNPSSKRPPAQETTETSNYGGNTRPGHLLFVFRSYMSDQFPFVIIPAGTTADKLRQEKPFLYMTILMVASYEDNKIQIMMAKEIWEYLCMHMIIQAEKSLDLLQGLLILIAWYQTHVHLARRMTIMLQLANALVIDLGINKKSAIRAAYHRTEASLRSYPEEEPQVKQLTLEECRAFLGHKYLNSAVSTYMKYTDNLGCTGGHAENCMYFLEQSAEYPSDEHLIQLMRLQNITQEINEALPRYSDDFTSGSSGPISMCMRTLQSKLESFRIKLPLHLQQNPFLLMHYHSLLAYLTETALSVPLPSRHAILRACLTSTQAFLSFLFCVPIADYYKFTYVSWAQLFHILVVLFKLSSFESPDWDLTHVRGVMDLSQILDKIISRFQEIQTSTNADGLLVTVIPKLMQYREAFEKKRATLMSGHAITPQSELEIPLHMSLDDLMFGQLDDGFWQEIMANWDPMPREDFTSQPAVGFNQSAPLLPQSQFMFGYPVT